MTSVGTSEMADELRRLLPRVLFSRWLAGLLTGLAFVLLAWTLVGCGAGGPDGEITAGERYPDRVAALAACLEAQGAQGTASELQNVPVATRGTRACPGGRWCCLEAIPDRPCPWAPELACGAAGLTYPNGVILLPDECDDALEHELLHAIGYAEGADIFEVCG